MALRQQPDHVVVPRLANVRARPITLFQLLNAEMIRHVRHARPLRFIAHQANCFAPPRESADSISRKPYDSFAWNDSSIMENMSLFRTETHEGGTRRIKASYSLSGSILLALGNLKSTVTEGHFRLGMMELPWLVLENLTSDEDDDEDESVSYDSRLVEFYRA